MPEKKDISLSKSDRLAAVDAELETAMDHLSEANQRIDELLTNLEEPEEDVEANESSPGEGGETQERAQGD